tara:strand:- start:207 stop:1151 length:945 start_codon:yes stop_codon:yes gene_type:complete
MENKIHLWPKGRLKLINIFTPNLYSSQYVENILRKRFKNQGHPILVSSGRVAITLFLISLNLKKNDKVRLFPFASHCVKEAVLRVCIPSYKAKISKNLVNIVYHQYGFINKNKTKGKIFEDAVDSLVKKNGKIFNSGGDFEVWSLNKILGSFGGAILWCKNKQVANKIKSIREKRKNYTNISWLLKLLSCNINSLNSLWYTIETYGGPVPKWALNQIVSDINTWDKLIKDRKKKLYIFKDLIPKWAQINQSRLPCALPVEISSKKISHIKKLGMKYGERHFLTNNNKLKKVFLISIHQDVSLTTLEKIKKILDD